MNKALSPDSFKLDDRGLYELFEETKLFAQYVPFEDGDVEHNWEAFFEEGVSYLKTLEDGSPKELPIKKCPPHLALFFAFISLYKNVQDQYNSLCKEHLHFFYKKVLGQQIKPKQVDKVYLFLELARNTDRFLLPKGEGFLAGKDSEKNPIVYRNDQDTYLGKAQISTCHAIYNNKNDGSSLHVFHDVSSPDEPHMGWHPFGNVLNAKVSAPMGFGINAPILGLHEGDRTIEISIILKENTAQNVLSKPIDASAWKVEIDTINGTLSRPLEDFEKVGNVLLFKISLSNMDTPIAIANPQDNITYPGVRLLLNDGYPYSLYKLFQNLAVDKLSVRVKATGLAGLHITNDFGVLEAKQAFQPFGFTPVVGNSFFVHAKELITKKPISITIKLGWKGAPKSFKNHYEGYLGETNSIVRSNDDFKISVSFRKGKRWWPISNDGTVSFSLFDDNIPLHIDPIIYENIGGQIEEDDGLVKISLSGPEVAFGHQIYPSVYTKAILAQTQMKDAPIPKQPYTPTIESIELGYEAEETLDLQQMNDADWQFHHITPFGISEKHNLGDDFSLLSTDYNGAGQLYIGLEQLSPPQQINLFFDVLEENVLQRPLVSYAYLTDDGWRKFTKEQVLSDTTLGLGQTGIVSLNVPQGATLSSKEMPEGLHWLRIETQSNPERFDKILAIKTNAIRATLDPANLNSDFPINSLAPNTIKALLYKNNGIKKIEQPLQSFGGISEEGDDEFFIRTSERLAHKNRALTSWDIEHMVLQEFPEVYQAICSTEQDKQGHVTLVIVPKLKKDRSHILKKPLAPVTLLDKINGFLKNRMSPHVVLNTTNANYEVLKVEAEVGFKSNYDEGYYLKELNAGLKKFLSPWAYGTEEKFEMGTVLYKSAILKFIELQPYIDFVARVVIYKDGLLVKSDEINTANNAILISAENHSIKPIPPDGLLCQTNQGIAQMIVDINFQVE